MPVLSVFSSVFCQKEPIVEGVLERTGYQLVLDSDVAARASVLSGMDVKKFNDVFAARTSVFNNLTHEKEHATAWLRVAMAEILARDNLVIDGFCGLLIPPAITYVLRICLIADVKARIARALQHRGLDEKAALAEIHRADEKRAVWIDTLFKIRDPWTASLYDILIPTDKTEMEDALDIIEKNLHSDVIRPTATSRRAAEDFVLSSQVGVALAREGHNVDVTARDGAISITIHKKVLMLKRLEEELKSIAEKVAGVQSVETRIGKGFHQADIYRKFDFNVPKLLLVDDEREFVQALSERLIMREMTPAVAYDGKSALDIVSTDEPEVMILDLKMPGIDGIEVLRQVKKTSPDVEIIILTGHGSDADRETCLSMGAFAYLQKPVDIDILTQTLRSAQEKINAHKAGRK